MLRVTYGYSSPLDQSRAELANLIYTGAVHMVGFWTLSHMHYIREGLLQTGDKLKIEKRIFEVHLDGNVWQRGEFVEIAQYPTVPEPTTLTLASLGLLAITTIRRRR